MAANDERLLARIVETLAAVPGIAAIVLGGSRARGTATPQSDYDIGLYYEGDAPFDHATLSHAAATLDDADATVTPIGEWGPWINGGGWLTIDGARVDLLYRDLGRVRAVIDDCHAGAIDVAYQPGHPHAFVSAIYMGEVAICRPLMERDAVLRDQIARTTPYPAALRTAVIRRFGWEAGFAAANARKSLDRGDSNYLAGCIFRAVACLCQTLFAHNGHYLLNEKGAVAIADRFTQRPERFAARIAALYRDAGDGDGDGAAALDALDSLIAETTALTGS
ncbi:nucleotidyltransferase domain-containing protein [Reyranella sp. CPCC 100927]|nr:nucleotidyltransferase domain-containing protein [Reyranella sp. CPCC 100927]